MNIKKKAMECMKNIKQFRYKGKKYAVSELDIATPTFEGCCAKKRWYHSLCS